MPLDQFDGYPHRSSHHSPQTTHGQIHVFGDLGYLVPPEDDIVQVTVQSTLLHCGADVLAVGKMSSCGLLPLPS